MTHGGFSFSINMCSKLLIWPCWMRPCVWFLTSAACPVGYFKSVSGSSPCSVCPANSRTSQEGASVCECRSGFYRAVNDDNSSACTSELCVLCLVSRPHSVGGSGSSLDSFDSFVSHKNQDIQSATLIHPLLFPHIMNFYNTLFGSH